MLLNLGDKSDTAVHVVKNDKYSSCEERKVLTDDISIIQNHIYFYSEVSTSSILTLVNIMSQMVKEHLGYAAQKCEKPDTIHLHIKSPGGSIHSGFIGYDYINAFKERLPIYTHIDGCAASAGTLLSICGTKRFISPSAYMMIHQLSSGVIGPYREIEDGFLNCKKMMDKLVEIYLKHSNLEEEKLREILKHDWYLTAEEAVQYNLVDEIKTVFF